jgi:hypothetical protein
MPAMPTQELKLTCGQCGYANEPERVYCHNCGAKLDRSVLPKGEGGKKEESPEVARKRISRMTNPSSTSLWREVKALLKSVGGGAFCAALLLIARTPEGVPDAKAQTIAPLIGDDLAAILQSPVPRSLVLSEADVNAHLAKTVKAKDGLIPGIEFKRMYVNFLGGNVLQASTEQSLWGFPIFNSILFKLDRKDGKLAPECVGGSFGRLRIHPAIMKHADFAFQKLWEALKREREQIERLQSVIVDKGRIQLVSRGAGR